MRRKRDDVPLEIGRRAARHLEAIRGTPLAPGSDGASLGDEVCPISRPDVRGVAYWEFEIVGMKRTGRRGAKGGSGFIVVSAGRHDAPIPHWSTEMESPSRVLEKRSGDGSVARVFKLDALAYVGEDRKGNYLSHIGQFPPMLDQLPKEHTVSSLESHPARTTKTDRRVAKQEVKRTAPRAPKPKVKPWASWGDAKKRYASTYKAQLAALRVQKEPIWEIEDLVAKFGEGLHEGERLTVPLLRDGKVELTGEGADAVAMRMLDRSPPAVDLLARGAEAKAEQEFQLRLTYDDGSTEALTFFVVPTGTPSNERRMLPDPLTSLHLRNGGSG